MITAVDTNILLDVLIPNQSHVRSSLRKLENASVNGQIIICEIVYSELASQFDDMHELNTFIIETHIETVWNNRESLFNAGQLCSEYRKQRVKKTSCTECGKSIDILCPECKSRLNIPHRILNDFIIGSHAKYFADGFLTRDRGFYRKYFSGLKLL